MIESQSNFLVQDKIFFQIALIFYPDKCTKLSKYVKPYTHYASSLYPFRYFPVIRSHLFFKEIDLYHVVFTFRLD